MTIQRTLDWRPNFDPESVPHRLAALDCYAGGRCRHSVRRIKKTFLDQGEEGACTGFSSAQVMNSSPKMRNFKDADARMLYMQAQRMDEWPGEDYEGSSVNGAMKALRGWGMIKAWRWAYNNDEAKHGTSYHGAGVFGLWWWTDMFETDSDGFIHPKGSKEGGHAIEYSGYKWINGSIAHRLDNSWGPDWGDNGGCWLWDEDFSQLLGDDGELAFPVKVAA